MAKASMTKEQYFISLLAGCTPDEIVIEQEMTIAALNRLRKKWGILDSDAENAALDQYQQSLPAPPAIESLPIPNMFVKLHIPIIDTKQSYAEGIAEAETAVRMLADGLSGYQGRERTVELTFHAVLAITNVLYLDLRGVLPPDQAARKIRSLISRCGWELNASSSEAAEMQGWMMVKDPDRVAKP